MKKTILILAPVLFTVLAISCDVETNYKVRYGKTVVHNNATSGRTIKRITLYTIAAYFSPETYLVETVSIPPGKSSGEYELEIDYTSGFYSGIHNSYRVAIRLDDDNTVSKDITAYEDIVNNLYFDGTDLVEKK